MRDLRRDAQGTFPRNTAELAHEIDEAVQRYGLKPEIIVTFDASALASLSDDRLVLVEMTARFWRYVDRGSATECWKWKGPLDVYGYGTFSFHSQPYKAHRLCWELWNDQPFPPKLCACHRCDVRACVNPLHIFPATVGDNVRDAASKGRMYMQGWTACKRGHAYKEGSYKMSTTPGRIGRICLRCRKERKEEDKQARRAVRIARNSTIAALEDESE